MAADPLSSRFSQRNLANTAYNEVFVSGSNLLVGTDNSGILTGLTIVPSSSYAISASYALNSRSSSYAVSTSYATNAGNAGTTLITGSTYPITSSWSLNAISSSYANSASYSLSSSYGLSASYAETSSYALSASYAFSASYSLSSSYSLSGSYAYSASYAVSASYASSASLAETASYVSASTIIGGDAIFDNITASNALIKNNLWVSGSIFASVFSSSYVYITSSQLVVTDNIITLNALSPYIRYAGIEMYDSGSGTLSSLLWDSEKNYFFVSSSDAGYARQVILGPELEASLIPGYIPLISSSNSITSSIMFQQGSTIIVSGNVSASIFSSSLGVGVGFYGTSSWALTSSVAEGFTTVFAGTYENGAEFLVPRPPAPIPYAISSSYSIIATTASYFSGSISNAVSSINSQTASYAYTSSLALTASYFSGSISNVVSSSYSITSSYSSKSVTASYYGGSVTSASYSLTSSFSNLSNNSLLFNSTSSTVFATTGSNAFNGIQTISNGYVILSQVSSSLEFVDDNAAALGGVPLGGLYRNGNFILIRIT